MIRVRISKDAANYIREEAQYLRQRSPAAARNFASMIKNAQQMLQTFPQAGKRGQGLQVKDSLTLVAGDYLLDYIYDGQTVDVVLIRHGRMLGPVPDIEDDEGELD